MDKVDKFIKYIKVHKPIKSNMKRPKKDSLNDEDLIEILESYKDLKEKDDENSKEIFQDIRDGVHTFKLKLSLEEVRTLYQAMTMIYTKLYGSIQGTAFLNRPLENS